MSLESTLGMQTPQLGGSRCWRWRDNSWCWVRNRGKGHTAASKKRMPHPSAQKLTRLRRNSEAARRHHRRHHHHDEMGKIERWGERRGVSATEFAKPTKPTKPAKPAADAQRPWCPEPEEVFWSIRVSGRRCLLLSAVYGNRELQQFTDTPFGVRRVARWQQTPPARHSESVLFD